MSATMPTTEKPFRPLLAATIENNEQLDSLTYPMIASPKIDGIRCVSHSQYGPITRSGKKIANLHIRKQLNALPLWGLDGEIVSGNITSVNVFNRTTTAVMSHGGEPQFMFHVFDTIALGGITPYDVRLQSVELTVRACTNMGIDYVRAHTWKVVHNPQDILEAEIDWLAHGYEGVMLRNTKGIYKLGRSTLREQILLKLKRFTDAEATIIGFEPLFSNQNPQTRNTQGLAVRSDHKAGLQQVETLGNLLVRCCSGRFGDFAIGSGFDQTLRKYIWDHRERYLGKTVTYKFQEVGVVEKPRFPIFLRFREVE